MYRINYNNGQVSNSFQDKKRAFAELEWERSNIGPTSFLEKNTQDGWVKIR